MLTNFSGELIFAKATVLRVAEEVSEYLVDKINVEKDPDANSPTKPPRKRKIELLYNQLLQGNLDHLKPDERRQFEPVLVKYVHVFHDENNNDFKGTKVIEHQILVGDAKPIRKPPCRTPFALRQEMETQVQEMLKKGVIRQTTST